MLADLKHIFFFFIAIVLVLIPVFYSQNGNFYIFVNVLSFPSLEKKTECIRLAGFHLVLQESQDPPLCKTRTPK